MDEQNNQDTLPFEIGIEKAKNDIINMINVIGQKYSIPSSILSMILQNIVDESKANVYSTIISNYDISLPKDKKNG